MTKFPVWYILFFVLFLPGCILTEDSSSSVFGKLSPTPTPTPSPSPTPVPDESTDEEPSEDPIATPTPVSTPETTPTPTPTPTPVPTPNVTAFHLVRGSTGVFIRELVEGDIIDLNLHGTDLSIEAVATSTTEAVSFSMGTHNYSDSTSVFYLNGDFQSFSFSEASYSLSVTPSNTEATSAPQSLNFSVAYGIHDPSIYPVAQGCSVPQSVAAKNKWYIDPVNGLNTNTGDFNSPWQSLDWVIENKLHTKAANGSDIRATAPIKAGDIIYLRSGSHGALNLIDNTAVRQAFNEDFITIKAQAGHQPVITNVVLQGARKFVFDGIKFIKQNAGTVLFLDNHGFWGESADIIIANSTVVSVEDISSMNTASYISTAPTAVNSEANCTSVFRNSFKHVAYGIQASGSKVRIQENTIDGFSQDGIQVTGNDTRIIKNRIVNNLNVDANHDDGIQAFVFDGPGIEPPMVDLVIDSNTVIQETYPAKPFKGGLQGIGLFDGFFDNLQITNNLVIVEAQHGITVLGSNNPIIANNTALGPSGAAAWIYLGPHKNGTTSEGWNVRNNLAASVSVNGSMTGAGSTSNNISFGSSPLAHFQVVDFINQVFDLSLISSSSAVNGGSTIGTPLVDIIGQNRGISPDIGAYESDF